MLRWAVLLCALAMPVAAAAQDGKSALRQELDRVYEQLLKTPNDIALNRRMITLAIQLKDYDAAIGAVERLIFYAPTDPDLQLEAARYYLAIKSYPAARGYVEDALALPVVSPAQKREADALILKIDNPSPWSFIGQAGMRYQSNANVGPYFLGPNEPYIVESPQPDWNDFVLGTGSYSYVMKHVAIEADISGYYADQFEVDRLDTDFAEINAGPRFFTSDGSLWIKPYATLQGILLGGDPYEVAYGAGIETRWKFADGWWFSPQAVYKRRQYYNSIDYGRAADQTGDLYTVGVDGAGQFSDNFSWRSRVNYSVNHANEAYQSFEQYYGRLSVRLGFDVFDWKGWALTPFASVSFTDYKGLAPTEANNPPLDTIRADFQWNAGVTLDIPVNETVGLSTRFQYTDNDSTLDRYTYRNFQVMSGPTVQF
jgi:hypothetical protein